MSTPLGGPSADPPPSPASKAAAVVVPPTASAATAFAISIDACVDHLGPNLDGLRAAAPELPHPDFLHQTRVATRRLRAALSLFSVLLRRDPHATSLRIDLRHLLLPLGPARDVDVLRRRAIDDGWPEQDIRRLDDLRRSRYAEAISVVTSQAWDDWWVRFGQWRGAGDWIADAPLRDAPARQVTDRALERRFRVIEAAGPRLTFLDPHGLHLIRIEGKKLRYGCQFFETLYPDAQGTPPLDYALTVGHLQDVFGAFNDRAVAVDLLAEAGIDADRLGPVPSRTDVVQAWREVMACTPFWR